MWMVLMKWYLSSPDWAIGEHFTKMAGNQGCRLPHINTDFGQMILNHLRFSFLN